jgi:hypothetical protein
MNIEQARIEHQRLTAEARRLHQDSFLALGRMSPEDWMELRGRLDAVEKEIQGIGVALGTKIPDSAIVLFGD